MLHTTITGSCLTHRGCPACLGTGQQLNQVVTGRVLREVRHKAGHSQQRVARLMRKSKQLVCDLEKGRCRWREELVRSYLKACGEEGV